MIYFIGILALILVIIGLWLGRSSQRTATETGISLKGVTVLHSDTGGGEELTAPLRSETYKLIGKPDYILETKQGIIPVELKPTRQAKQPYESDLMQLAAYCLLVEDCLEHRPPYGLLRYADISFKVTWDEELKQQLLAILDEMRDLANYPAYKGQTMPEPQHDMTVRCTNCAFHYVCWQD
jgi:CRISPR-associated exonuclease Cas4